MPQHGNMELDLFIDELPQGSHAQYMKPTMRWVIIVQLARNWQDIQDAIIHERFMAAEARWPRHMSQKEFTSIPFDMEVYDEAIVGFAVYSNDEYREARLANIVTPNYGAYVRNCANCGGGLGLIYCFGCGQRFEDDFFSVGWDVPLPLKIIHALEARGHRFVLNPRRLIAPLV